MSGLRLAALALLATVAQAPVASAAPCPVDPAQPLRPCDLEVLGGEERWHPDTSFTLRWRNPPQDDGPPVAGFSYRVFDDTMRVVREKRLDLPLEMAATVKVPPAPGIYMVELRLENAAGSVGPAAMASLRFDDSPPGSVEPQPNPGWIGRADFPYPLRLNHPDGEPLSGIRGYAVAIGRDPCLAVDRCTEAETSLRGGREDDTLLLPSLPEGTSYAHAVAVSGAGKRSASASRTALRVDTTAPRTTLLGVPDSWANGPVELLASASDAASGLAPAGPAGPFTAIRIDGGAPIVAAGDAVRARVVGAGVHTVAHYARDAAGNVDDGGDARGAPNPAPATTTVRIDPAPPRVVFAGAQDPSEPEAIEARVVDPLSGPGQRGRIELRQVNSGDRFAPLPTTVEDGVLRARWDSESYPPGPYEFRATGFDLAGNEAATRSRPNGSRMVLAAPLKAATELRLRLGERRQGRRASSASLYVQGRLSGGRRHRLAAMSVRVIERFDPGAAERQRVSTLRTGPDGGFALRLRPGPSREVVAAFGGTASLARSQSEPIRIDVPGTIRMTASSSAATVGGRPVVFRGRVGGEIPSGGKYVQLQFRLPGLRWTEFRTVRTDARGRFRHAYRFSDDDSRGVRFQFRALAPAQDDWPYEPVGSRPVAVRGR
jgi:hypothetical protein